MCSYFPLPLPIAMTSGQLPFPTHPPDIDCFLNGGTWHLGTFGSNNCSVTSNMVDFLNLTGSDYKPYFAAYCLNPPADDDCPFGFCPNPDITGPLVRVASESSPIFCDLKLAADSSSDYITGFCLCKPSCLQICYLQPIYLRLPAILVLYSPKRIEAAFWSQILLTYSLLFSCGISLIRGELTQFHSVALITIVSSPVNVYFASCSIRAFWGTHRLDAVLGKKQYIQRALVVFSSLIWIAIFVYTYLPKRCTKFAQASCQWYSSMGFFSLGLFFMYHLPWGVIFLFQHPDTKGVTLRLPVAMLFYVLPHLSWFAKMW